MRFGSCSLIPPLVALAFSWFSNASVSGQTVRSLFVETAAALVAGQDRGYARETPARGRWARVDPAVLAQLSARLNEEVSFRIRLDGGTEQVATVRKLKTSDDGYRVLAGTLAGEATSQIIFVTDGEYLAGSVHMAGSGSFQILPLGKGICALKQLGLPAIPLCGALPRQASHASDGKANLVHPQIAREQADQATALLPIQNAGERREIEVMMLYTTAARVIAGDVAAMEAQARLSVEEANLVMANSNVGVRFRVVHMAEIAYEASGDLQVDLQRVWSSSGDGMAEVSGWRDLYKADLVCLVVERSDTSAGTAYFATGPEDGFSVVNLPYLTGYYIVAHELGHNLGCDHDRENALGGGAFPFSYGYRFAVAGFTNRTVMAYEPGERIPFYSSPDIAFNGVPIGIPEGSPGEADNARTIRAMAAFVDSYRGLTIELTQPASGNSFPAKQRIELAAVVSSDEGPVVSVEFLDGESLLGEAADAPYQFSWTNPAPGRHEISARTRIAAGGDVRSGSIVIGVSPANDDFADRLPLSGLNAVGTAILYAATSEAGEPLSVLNGGGTAWWSWTAPQDGLVRVSASAIATGKSAVFVFSGTALDQLQPIRSTRISTRELLFHAAAGEQYQICLAGGPENEPVSVYVAMQVAPGNDNFVNAQQINWSSGSLEGSTVAATAEPDEPSIGAHPPGHSIWFLWSPPFSGLATLALAPGTAKADFAVYRGTNLASLALVANSTAARQGFPVAAQQSYFIAVDGEFQPISLALKLVKSAANDNFAKRNPTTPNGPPLLINPATATREPNEPVHGRTRGGHSQWWSWRASANGGVRMARPSATALSRDLSVAWYTGDALSNLVQVGSCDFTNALQDAFVMPVRIGTNYSIAIETGDGPIQGVQLDFQQASANDNFRQRQAYVSGGSGTTITGTTLGATAEQDEPAHGGQPAAHSVWWSWASPTAATVSLTVDSTGQSLPRLSIYTGTTLTNLVLIGENSTNGQTGPTVTFAAGAGGRYSFAIDETTSGYNYSLALKYPSAPANDNFAHAETLPSPFLPSIPSAYGSTIGATLEPNEPEHLQNGPSSVTSSVWYTWTAPSDHDMTGVALGRRSGTLQAMLPEPVVAVYEGASPGNLTRVDANIGSATFHALRGVQYRIAVASFTAQAQDFILRIVPVAGNDRFETAFLFPGYVTILPTQLRAATHQPGEPNHAGQSSGHSLWWTWIAPLSGQYRWSHSRQFANQPSSMSLVTAVYTGTNLATLTVVSSNAWSGVTFPAEAGKRYYLALDLKDPRINSFSEGQTYGVVGNVSRYPTLFNPQLSLNQEIQLSIGGSSGQVLSLEASSDLIHWQPVRQINPSGADYRYSEPTSLMAPSKFFRLILLQDFGAFFAE
jgi:hypothetical protein